MTTITKPYQDFVNNIDVVDAVKINAQLNQIYNWLNGTNIDFTNLAVSAYSKTAAPNTLAERDSSGNVVSAYPVSNGQNPNLLYNPSARLGTNGWAASGTGNNWSAVLGGGGEGGYFQVSSASATSSFWINESQKMNMANGIGLNISGEIYTAGQTSGSTSFEIDAFNSSDVNLGVVCSVVATNGQGFTKYTVSGLTPANTTYVKARLVFGTGSVSTLTAFRKLKVESGNYPTTFSDDSTLNTLQYSGILPFDQALSGGNKAQSGATASTSLTQNTWVTIAVTLPVAFSTAPQEVQLTLIGAQARVYLTVTGITATGFTINAYNIDATISAYIGYEVKST